jgi:hypothetical protein
MPTQRLCKLSAREYKLLLDFEHFGPSASVDTANTFWKEMLIPAIASKLDRREIGEERAEGEFDEVTERTVQFWDTGSRTLTDSHYALRTRMRPAKSKGPRTEITLKLRMPDMFVVGTTDLPGKSDYEEDIAPLEIVHGSKQHRTVLPATPRSLRSQFSMSATCETDSTPAALRDAYRLFPTLKKSLADRGESSPAKTPLICGPVIQESVHEGAKVKLGGGIKGKFTLTLWRFSSRRPVPGIAEISFNARRNPDSCPPMPHGGRLRCSPASKTNLANWSMHATQARRRSRFLTLCSGRARGRTPCFRSCEY